MPLLASAKAVVIVVQVVLCCVVDAVVTAIWNVMPVLVHVKETAMVAAVNVAEIVPAHVQIHVLVHASGLVQITAGIHAQVTVKVAAQLDALLAMVALIVVVAMVPAQSDVTHHVIYQPMLNFNIFSFSERSFND